MSKNITFVCGENIKTFVFDGKKTVFDLLIESGIKLDYPCGGKKTCGKCKIKITDGFEFVSEPDETEKKLLSANKEENVRYACMCEVFGDVTVELSSELLSDKIEVQTEGFMSKNITPDKFKKITVTLTKPTLENPISDEKNLINALGLTSKTLPLSIIKKLPELNTREIDVILSGDKIIDVRAAGECGKNAGIA